MRKRTVSAILLSPVFILVAIYAVLISPLGGPAIKVVANAFVPGLSIDKIEGSFADTLDITQLHWQNPQWEVTAQHLYIDVTWRCFFEPRVCVNDASLDNASIVQLATSPDSEPTPSSAQVVLPLPIEVTYLSLSQIRVELLTTTVTIEALELSDFFGSDKLVLEDLALKGLTIALPDTQNSVSNAQTSQQTATTLPTSYSLSYEVPNLPHITTPIPLTLGNLLIEDFTFIQGSSKQHLATISLLDSQFKGHGVKVDQFALTRKDGELKGGGKVTLKDNYPLSLNLNARTQVEEREQQISVRAKGALDALEISLEAQGAVNANASLSADILNTALPLQFNATWKEQPIPTMSSAVLKAGSLSLTGVMGDYHLTGFGAATLPDIGNIPVSLDVVLKKHNIYVNEANIEALEGQLTNTGTLYLNEVIAWEGKTTLTGVSAKQFSKYAPTELHGEIDSILQYSQRKGLNMSLRNLNLSGLLQEKPFQVTGSAVYAGPSDLLVTNINIKQEQNAIRAVAQVLNKRHLNADININATAIENMYPEISGAITGNIKAVGPWQNPTATGQLSIDNISVSPKLSLQAAQYGPINGDITMKGAFDDHSATINLAIPDNTLSLQLNGAWEKRHWKGTISDTKLKLANMHWTLSSPFSLDIGTDPITANITAHCWTSRREGELCVSNINYQQALASWDVKASSLPVGLWAHEIVPHIISAPSEATLTINTKGSYSTSDPIDATFTASLSSATWQLSDSRPFNLTINSIETEGKIKQGALSSTSLIISEDIGDATLIFNTRPLDERKPLDGRLIMRDLDVAPFKPLSPAIRTLTGVLNGDITLQGYLDEPSLSGELTITNGAIDIQDTPVTLADWNQTVTLDHQTAQLEGSFVLGGGEGTLSGNLNWSSTPSANFTLRGNAFEVRQPNVRLRLSPNIDIAATKERVDVTGDINIPWARIEIESLPESAVSPSKDVHLRGEPDREEPLDIIHASVMVYIDKAKTQDVKLDAFGLTASLHGGIQVNTQPALVGYGDLQILNGRYSAYGQQLIIQTGEVQFNGPIDQPLLLVEAIRDPAKTDDDVIAGIRIDGPADSPSINLFSKPAMDQQGVLSYLLTGSGPNSGTQDPNYAGLLLGFGLSNTKTLTGQVGDALGIDDFSLSTNENMLSVTGQINERLSVEYNVDVGLSNNDANSTLRRRQLPPDLALKYQLLPSLYLEAIQTTLEDQSEFALDLYYEFFLGDNRDKDEEEDDTE
ncbi:translocation/assembly module TamB domain-containing protein [Alteromonas sp. D210916BOD_24]|uniref:translocation/assembly module TamB domain-containing protein n=1 Tax=Alteromonas sp. D210916BOD_24 TaxID=3157618 RepID=UPI00399CEC42